MADFRFWKQPQLLKRSLQVLKWFGGAVAVGVSGASIVGIVWWLPQKQVEPLKTRIESLEAEKPTTEAEKPTTFEYLEKLAQQEKALIDAENAARTGWIQALGGIFAAAAAYIAWQNYKAIQEKNVADRFNKATEQLGHQDIQVRLGGIFALEKIANSEDSYYWQVIQMLTAYVRQRSPWPATKKERQIPARDPNPPELDEDIQAVMTVLSRRNYSYGKSEEHRLNLNRTDLRKVELPKGTNFKHVDLRYAILEHAILPEINLEGARLFDTLLFGASLTGAQLNSAYLVGTDLFMANLENADLRNANLRCAKVHRANLENADLRNANLHAFVSEAIFSNANLESASFCACSLAEAWGRSYPALSDQEIGLTQTQLNAAKSYTEADLPRSLQQSESTEES